MNSKKLPSRIAAFSAGLVVNAFGIACITKAGLGTSPISSVPYVLSLGLKDLSFGVWTFILNMLFITAQIMLLRHRFRKVQLLQIPVNFVFSVLIDLAMSILYIVKPQTFMMQILTLTAGCILLGYGVALEVAPSVIMVPGEGIVVAVSRVSGKPFSSTKNLFDLFLMAAAALLSLLFFHRFKGIGLGTLISAVLVGRFVSLFSSRSRLISTVADWSESVLKKQHPAKTEAENA